MPVADITTILSHMIRVLSIWLLYHMGGVLRIGVACDKIINGSVAEWLKAHDSKSCRRATVSRVQIPPLPPGIVQGIHGVDVF